MNCALKLVNEINREVCRAKDLSVPRYMLISDKYLCQLWLAWCRVLFL